MKILLTGKNGQTGWELQRTLSTLGEVAAPDRYDLDLVDPGAIAAAIGSMKPDIIVNAAAYTAVDRAEAEPEKARMINAIAPTLMAQEARKAGSAIIHYSTDYVFDGETLEIPYTEEAATAPLNVYGHTKLEGDMGVMASGAPYLILRTAWVYSAMARPNFLASVMNRARQGGEIRMVADQTGSPTWARVVAEATAQIISKLSGPKGVSFEGFEGVYNVACKGNVTRFQQARAIIKRMKLDAPVDVIPIKTAEYPLPARRPAHSALSVEKVEKTFGLCMPQWEQSLGLCMEEAR
ncbi:MAG: dTDP-4-dehydrorhamnose reductase [Nitrospinae bacterium]|nr:dTDP-4-dehydrorhamnose reductase [Nitrospinota bacterium]